jgi:hypothetical protein
MSADEAGQVARLLGDYVLPELVRAGCSVPSEITVRRAARLLLDAYPGASMVGPDSTPQPARVCAGCDATVPESEGPTPRKWCSDACRSRARRRRPD